MPARRQRASAGAAQGPSRVTYRGQGLWLIRPSRRCSAAASPRGSAPCHHLQMLRPPEPPVVAQPQPLHGAPWSLDDVAWDPHALVRAPAPRQRCGQAHPHDHANVDALRARSPPRWPRLCAVLQALERRRALHLRRRVARLLLLARRRASVRRPAARRWRAACLAAARWATAKARTLSTLACARSTCALRLWRSRTAPSTASAKSARCRAPQLRVARRLTCAACPVASQVQPVSAPGGLQRRQALLRRRAGQAQRAAAKRAHRGARRQSHRRRGGCHSGPRSH